jgi:hypothetical protein
MEVFAGFQKIFSSFNYQSNFATDDANYSLYYFLIKIWLKILFIGWKIKLNNYDKWQKYLIFIRIETIKIQ